MPYLVAASPAVRRGWLNPVETYSRLVADGLLAESGGRLSVAAAGVLGWSFVAIFHVIVDAVGQAMRSDAKVDGLIAVLRPQIDAALDVLEHGLGDAPAPSGPQLRGDLP